MSMLVSTDRLISSSEARRKFGQLLEDVASDQDHYFVILENGKVTALLVNPGWLEEKQSSPFPSLKTLRKSWGRYEKEISKAMKHLSSLEKNQLPKFLR